MNDANKLEREFMVELPTSTCFYGGEIHDPLLGPLRVPSRSKKDNSLLLLTVKWFCGSFRC